MTNVLILGGTGMLGRMLVDVLPRELAPFQVWASARTIPLAETMAESTASGEGPRVKWIRFDARNFGQHSLDGFDWIVNAIGLTKPHINDLTKQGLVDAISLNALFPHHLADLAARAGAKVLHVSSDCVYSGKKGTPYLETDPHDATDIYGKSKSLGEPSMPHFWTLRTSIIGPELRCHKNLFAWFMNNGDGMPVKGFTNHYWSGVTTYQLARVLAGFIKHGLFSTPCVTHLVPGAVITKCALLEMLNKAFGRTIDVIPKASAEVDLRLKTVQSEVNQRLWEAAGYDAPPLYEQMLGELAGHMKTHEWREAR